ncbi:MAG: SIS domain-containing protein [Magnetococcus sp. WYHC-3]
MDIHHYFSQFSGILQRFLDQADNHAALKRATALLEGTRNNGARIHLLGNGGSAAIAEHMAIDLTKNAGLRALAPASAATLTCLANDLGYEQAYARIITAYGAPGDVLVAISSSGTSRNILAAVAVAKERGMAVITLSGFGADNPLRTLGEVNLWIDSHSYGYVEILHNLLIHYMNDAIIGRTEYVIR